MAKISKIKVGPVKATIVDRGTTQKRNTLTALETPNKVRTYQRAGSNYKPKAKKISSFKKTGTAVNVPGGVTVSMKKKRK